MKNEECEICGGTGKVSRGEFDDREEVDCACVEEDDELED